MITRTLPIRLLGRALAPAVALAWVLSGCHGKSGGAEGKADSSVNETESGGTNEGSNEDAEGDDQAQFVAAQPPVATTGINLVADYDNARIRCDLDSSGGTPFKVFCETVVTSPSGGEFRATAIAPGTTFAWSHALSVAATPSTCEVSADRLRYSCEVDLAEARFVTLSVELAVSDTKHAVPREESVDVPLPFAVDVVAGYVPRIAQGYRGAAVAAPDADGPVARGFQPITFPVTSSEFPGILSFCRQGDVTYFARERLVYQVKNGIANLYAGLLHKGPQDATRRHQLALGTELYLACSGEAVLISDTEHDRILKIAPGQPVEVVAGAKGKGSAPDGAKAQEAPLTSPRDLLVRSDGGIVFIEGNRVRAIENGALRTLAGTGAYGASGDGGAASAATLRAPRAIAVAADGRLFIADTGSHSVRVVRPDGVIERIAGTGVHGIGRAGYAAAAEPLASPVALSVTASDLYVGELYRGVWRIGADGKLATMMGSDLVPPRPVIAIMKDGTLDERSLLEGRSPLMDFEVDGDGSLTFVAPTAIVRRAKDGTRTNLIGIPSRSGCGKTVSAHKARLILPVAVTLDGDGGTYFVDRDKAASTNLVIRRLSAAGAGGPVIETLFGCDGGSDFQAPLNVNRPTASLDLMPNGSLLFVNGHAGVILELRANGDVVRLGGTGAPGSSPDGTVATAASLTPVAAKIGGDGSVYFIDGGGGAIRKIGGDGKLVTLAGAPEPATGGDGPGLERRIEAVSLAVGQAGDVFFHDVLGPASAAGNLRRLKDGVIDTVLTLPAPTGGGRVGGLAALRDGTLWFSESDRVWRLRAETGSPGFVAEPLPGSIGTKDCASGSIGAAAGSASVFSAFKSTLATFCRGTQTDLAAFDGCQTAQSQRVVIAQKFGEFANLLELELPCLP